MKQECGRARFRIEKSTELYLGLGGHGSGLWGVENRHGPIFAWHEPQRGEKQTFFFPEILCTNKNISSHTRRESPARIPTFFHSLSHSMLYNILISYIYALLSSNFTPSRETSYFTFIFSSPKKCNLPSNLQN